MGLLDKLDALLELKPDVAILPEAGDPSVSSVASVLAERHMTYEWLGPRPRTGRTKGLAVLARGSYRLERAFAGAHDLEWILPLRVTGPAARFTLIAAWAMNHRASNRLPGEYHLRQVDRALEIHRDLLSPGPIVVAGDFNNAVRWDEVGRAGLEGNFAVTASRLADIGLVSAYHKATGKEFGHECADTFFQRSSGTTHGYHIDYCFIPTSWSAGVEASVGSLQDWVGSGLSDHAPLIIDVAT
jgi:hypothetical protein